MGDWIGLAVIVLVVAGGLFGLSQLGRPPKPVSKEEFERRVQEGGGAMTAGVGAGLHALQKLMNPKAAEAVEVQKDLRAGHYNESERGGEGGDGTGDAPEGCVGDDPFGQGGGDGRDRRMTPDPDEPPVRRKQDEAALRAADDEEGEDA